MASLLMAAVFVALVASAASPWRSLQTKISSLRDKGLAGKLLYAATLGASSIALAAAFLLFVFPVSCCLVAKGLADFETRKRAVGPEGYHLAEVLAVAPQAGSQESAIAVWWFDQWKSSLQATPDATFLIPRPQEERLRRQLQERERDAVLKHAFEVTDLPDGRQRIVLRKGSGVHQASFWYVASAKEAILTHVAPSRGEFSPLNHAFLAVLLTPLLWAAAWLWRWGTRRARGSSTDGASTRGLIE
ncbi:MAG: hypothetical protein HY927_09890 [Elusimicrobia bacterium]|nr:hypothetical protein [Elusimicrobiota bacterium]